MLIAVRELTDDYVSERGGDVELTQLTIARVADPPEWFRPALLHARIELDETGELGDALRTATTVDPGTAGEPLDGYVNMYYRSAKNARAGLRLASLLDAQESVGWFLQFVFTAHGRVRPYNKWLEWELREHPLPVEVDLARLKHVATTADITTQQALFRDVERIARDAGLGAVVDGWHPDLGFLRGAP